MQSRASATGPHIVTMVNRGSNGCGALLLDNSIVVTCDHHIVFSLEAHIDSGELYIS